MAFPPMAGGLAEHSKFGTILLLQNVSADYVTNAAPAAVSSLDYCGLHLLKRRRVLDGGEVPRVAIFA